MYFQNNLNLTSTQYIAEKMEIQGEPSIETLKQFRKYIEIDQSNITHQMIEFQTKVFNNQQEVYQAELNNLHRLISTSHSVVSTYPIHYVRFMRPIDDKINLMQINRKILKFFSPQYDLLPAQKKALNIFNYTLSIQQPLSYNQLQIVYRVIGIYYQRRSGQYKDALEVLVKILKQIQVNSMSTYFMNTITDFNGLDILKKYLYYIGNWEHLDLVTDVISYYLDTLIKIGQKQKIQILSLKFIDFIQIMIDKLPDQTDYQNQLLSSIQTIFNGIPCLKFYIEQLYSDQNQINLKNTKIKIELAQKLYKKGLFDHIIHLRQNPIEQFNKIFKVIPIILRSIKIQQFKQYILPIVEKYYNWEQQRQLFHFQHNLNSMLLQFIHVHKQTPYIINHFVDIFCKSKILEYIIDHLNKKCIKLSSDRYYMNQVQKQQHNNIMEQNRIVSYNNAAYQAYQHSKRLFMEQTLLILTLLAFEIIKQCKIITYPNCDFHQTLQKSVILICQNKKEWPANVVRNLMQEMTERQKIHGQQYNWFINGSYYHAQYQI